MISLCLTTAVLVGAWGLVRITRGTLGLSEDLSLTGLPVRAGDKSPAELEPRPAPVLR